MLAQVQSTTEPVPSQYESYVGAGPKDTTVETMPVAGSAPSPPFDVRRSAHPSHTPSACHHQQNGDCLTEGPTC